MFRWAQESSRYWPRTEASTSLPAWKRNKELLAKELHSQDVYDAFSDAARQVERLSSVRALRFGGQVEAKVRLPEAIEALESAHRSLDKLLPES